MLEAIQEAGLLIPIIAVVLMIVEAFILKKYLPFVSIKKMINILYSIADYHNIGAVEILTEALEAAAKLKENTQDVESTIHNELDDIKKKS